MDRTRWKGIAALLAGILVAAFVALVAPDRAQADCTSSGSTTTCSGSITGYQSSTSATVTFDPTFTVPSSSIFDFAVFPLANPVVTVETGASTSSPTTTTLSSTGGVGAGSISVTVQSGATFGTIDLAPDAGSTAAITIAGTVNSIVVSSNASASVVVSGTVNNGITLQGGGSVELDPGGSFSGSTVAVSGGTGTFVLGGSGTGTFDLSGLGSTLTGFSQFTKQGSSTWILTGTNSTSLTATVNGGTLEVGDANNTGTTLTGSATVGASGTLSGHGTITGDVTNNLGGIVAPGGTIGTLSVGGNYTQGSTSTLQIEVSPSAASQLNVTGTATLAGTLNVVYEPGVYTTKTYDIVHAGSVAGTFSSITGSAPSGVTPSLAYAASDVNLTLTYVAVAPTNASTFTAASGTMLNSSLQASDLLLSQLTDAHLGTGAAGVRTSLAAGDPVQLAFAGSNEQLAGLIGQLPDTLAKYGGWFRAYGNFSALGGNAAVPGLDTTGGGFLAGIDRPLADNTRIGVAGGYMHTDVGVHDGTSGAIDTPRLMLYGSHALGPWYLDASVGYAFDRIGVARPISSVGETARSSHDGHEASTMMQASYRIDAGNNVIVMPKGGLDYVHLFETSFAEAGAPGFDLVVSSRNTDSLRPFIGGSAATTYFTESGVALTPEFDLDYSHELLNIGAASLVQVGGGSFSVVGITPSRDQVTVGAGLTAQMDSRLALLASYRAILRTGNTSSQTVAAELRYGF